jgi:putative phage-type endonuclease
MKIDNKEEEAMIKEISYANRDEWLAIRNQYIGGSDAGAVVGLNPYKSAYTLWAEKTGALEPFSGSLTTEVGAYLEQFVAELFCRETGKKVRRKNRVLVNDRYPFACANVDRLIVGEKALLEIKSTTSLPMTRKLRDGGEEFPDAYYAQVVHYLAVTELERAFLAVLVNNRELLIYELERDQAEIDALMDAEELFWMHVTGLTPPEADGSDSTSETLGALYHGGEAETVPLDGVEDALRVYETLGAQIKTLETERKAAANRIKAAMGDSERGQSASFIVTYTGSSRRAFDAEKFSADHGDIDLAVYYKTTYSRTLRIKPVSA